MIKIEKTETFGWEAAIRGMRNPRESWEKSDTNWEKYTSGKDICRCIGENDLNLMKKLVAAGTDHRKFMRMIVVCLDIAAPLYWWKEMDTYKVGTVANSCSTMHKIADKELTLEDFSFEHLRTDTSDFMDGSLAPFSALNMLEDTITIINTYRECYLETKDKEYWWQMIQLLPTSYNQRRMVMLNYEVLTNIYKSRKNHKLDEWRDFCKWIESLPYSELITGGDANG